MPPPPALARDPSAERPFIGSRLVAMGAFLIVVSVLTVFCGACLAILAGARAYSAAEGHFSRGQKNAVILLQDYLDSRNEADFAAATRALAPPLAARVARDALLADEFDYEAAKRALMVDGDDATDVRAMILVGRLARHAARAEAVWAAWREADAALARLDDLAREIHRAVRSAPVTDGQRRDFALRLFQLNDALDVQESGFAAQLGRDARWIQSGLITATLALALFLTVTRLLFMRMMSERLSRSHEWIMEGNARWALAAKASNLGLLDWQPDTDTTLLDERARAMFGIIAARPGPLAASWIRSYVHEADRQALRAAAEAAMAGFEATTRRFRVQHADGQVRTLEMAVRAFSSTSDKPRHMLGLVRDVTADVDAERLRTEESALRRANQLKSKFFSQVSHELRTPLNAVLGFSELLRDDPEHPLSVRQRDRVDHVVEGGQYLLRLVNDLLDRASLEHGELSVTMQAVGLREIVHSAIGMLEPMKASRRLSLDIELPPAALRVHADPIRLKQVLVNLLSNAVKYNRADGAIHLRCTAAGDSVTVSIRDEGQGLSAAQQKALFVPFQRLGAEASVPDGAGLGLVISRHLVERQGGSLSLESEVGRGTTVAVRLKAARGTPPARREDGAAAAAPASAGRAGVVLYIEDDPVNVILLEEYLRAWRSVRLLVATDGRSGIDCARAHLPDLVVLDMQLPDMTGLEVLEALKSQPATRHLPVVALSASAMGDQTVEAMELGVDDYWTKPISCEKLRSEVAKYLH